MNKQQLLDELEKLGMRPGRGLGQNFLLDGNMLEAIVRDAKIKPGELVLEVGPGFGALTRLLLDAGARVLAIEFDRRLAERLRRVVNSDRFTLIEADACKVDFYQILPENEPFRAIANLPYAISSVFIARMLELPQPPTAMSFMLQKEMADRLAASPGTKNYGGLSVRTQLLYEVRISRNVPPEVFYPAPEVDSAIADFTLRTSLPDPKLAKRVCGVVRTAFGQRRKQLCKVLGAVYGVEKVREAFAALEMPPEIRPDRLTVEDFVNLTGEIFK
ncbi:MAG: 16S rRNA (adenine(1518)-N(6)/adenine(1519)-N(6))-dimethyltransferase RsmA [Victivallaceae bacterium]